MLGNFTHHQQFTHFHGWTCGDFQWWNAAGSTHWYSHAILFIRSARWCTRWCPGWQCYLWCHLGVIKDHIKWRKWTWSQASQGLVVLPWRSCHRCATYHPMWSKELSLCRHQGGRRGLTLPGFADGKAEILYCKIVTLFGRVSISIHITDTYGITSTWESKISCTIEVGVNEGFFLGNCHYRFVEEVERDLISLKKFEFTAWANIGNSLCFFCFACFSAPDLHVATRYQDLERPTKTISFDNWLTLETRIVRLQVSTQKGLCFWIDQSS